MCIYIYIYREREGDIYICIYLIYNGALAAAATAVLYPGSDKTVCRNRGFLIPYPSTHNYVYIYIYRERERCVYIYIYIYYIYTHILNVIIVTVIY